MVAVFVLVKEGASQNEVAGSLCFYARMFCRCLIMARTDTFLIVQKAALEFHAVA